MCNLFDQSLSLDDLLALYEIQEVGDLDVAMRDGKYVFTAPDGAEVSVGDAPISLRSRDVPSSSIALVRNGDYGRAMEMARWGLIRHWNKRKPGTKTVFTAPTPTNARDDKIFSERMYAGLLPKKRCVIPIRRWGEFIGPKGHRSEVWLEGADEGALSIAGIYDDWFDPEAEAWVRSAAMVTVASNEFTRPWHEERRIKPLWGDEVDIWLDTSRKGSVDDLHSILDKEDDGLFKLTDPANFPPKPVKEAKED